MPPPPREAASTRRRSGHQREEREGRYHLLEKPHQPKGDLAIIGRKGSLVHRHLPEKTRPLEGDLVVEGEKEEEPEGGRGGCRHYRGVREGE